jgi:hypothetical protein
MSYLLDTDICSAYLKNDRLIGSRVTWFFTRVSRCPPVSRLRSISR